MRTRPSREHAALSLALVLSSLTILTALESGCGYFDHKPIHHRTVQESPAPVDSDRPTRVSTPPQDPAEAELEIIEERIEDEAERLERGEYAVQVNRTLIYPMQWLRAESVADTLSQLLISQYGPNTRVIAHPDTNQLLIYLPPPAEWNARGRPGVSPGLPRSGATPNRAGTP